MFRLRHSILVYFSSLRYPSLLVLLFSPTRRSSDLAAKARARARERRHRDDAAEARGRRDDEGDRPDERLGRREQTFEQDRKSTRLNSSHLVISYAVFCLKIENKTT